MPVPLWTHRLASPARGISFARESGHVLAWDQNCWLVLLDRQGRLQAQIQLTNGIVSAALADDGSCVVDADEHGTITWRSPDLATRWRQKLDSRPTALTVDALGRALAVADSTAGLHFFAATGRSPWPPIALARPFQQLAFVPTVPAVVGAADFGLVACVDLGQRRAVWQDAPVVHLGGLAVTGQPATVTVSCFSEGLRRYAITGMPLAPITTPEPCRFVAASYSGQQFLVGGVFGGVHLLSDSGSIITAERVEQPVVALALSALGDFAVIALVDGRVIGIDMRTGG